MKKQAKAYMNIPDVNKSKLLTAITVALDAIIIFCVARSMWINRMPPQTETLLFQILKASFPLSLSASIITTLIVYFIGSFMVKRKLKFIKYLVLTIVLLITNLIIFGLSIRIVR